MNWFKIIEDTIEYIESNITEELDYDELAGRAYSSRYHFQRVFGIFSGYTLGEYIRFRRLTLAGKEINETDIKVIDVAVKYCYDSPDSFAKAFTRFHGISPSAAREKDAKLNSFSRLSLKNISEGGNTMNYRIENKPAMKFLGIGKRCIGSPADRYNQIHDFCVEGETRFMAFALQGMANDCETLYHVIRNVDDEGFDFVLSTAADEYLFRDLPKHLGEVNAQKLTVVDVPEHEYVVVRGEKTLYYMRDQMALRQSVVTEWFTDSGYRMADAPEIVYTHSDIKKHSNSYVELWIPIEKDA